MLLVIIMQRSCLKAGCIVIKGTTLIAENSFSYKCRPSKVWEISQLLTAKQITKRSCYGSYKSMATDNSL